MVSRTAILVGVLAVACGGCGDKKSKPSEAKTSDRAPKTTSPAAKSQSDGRKRRVVQKLSLDERRKRLLAMAGPEMRKAMLAKPGVIPTAHPSEVVHVSTGVVRIGDATVHLKKGRIEIPGVVALKSGEIIEYLVVGPNGKAYESVFSVETKTTHFRLALTLAGLRPAAPSPTNKPSPITPESSMRILVRVSDKPGAKETPAVLFTRDRQTDKPLNQPTWQMTGFTRSFELTAMTGGQLVATRYDQTALVNATSETGNPYASAKTGLVVSDKTPAVGTKVTLVFMRTSNVKSPAKPKATK